MMSNLTFSQLIKKGNWFYFEAKTMGTVTRHKVPDVHDGKFSRYYLYPATSQKQSPSEQGHSGALDAVIAVMAIWGHFLNMKFDLLGSNGYTWR